MYSNQSRFKKGDRILGIDPGSRVAGFAILELAYAPPVQINKLIIHDVGIIKLKPKLDLGTRIGQLHEAFFTIIKEEQVKHAAMEQAFVGSNPQSALKLGEARGAIQAAACRHGLSVSHVTPAEVKQTICGDRYADKESIKNSLRCLLGFHQPHLPSDATDALAIGLHYAISAS